MFKDFSIYPVENQDGKTVMMKFGQHALDYFNPNFCEDIGDSDRRINIPTFRAALAAALDLDDKKKKSIHPDRSAMNHYVKLETGEELVVALDMSHDNKDYDVYVCNVIRNTANKKDMRNRINRDFRRLYKGE